MRHFPVVDRLILKTKKIGNGCIVWTGTSEGSDRPLTSRYGLLRANKKRIAAHRLAYEFFVGPIQDGLCVLHKCDNPPYVNPLHLRLGTQAENVKDRDAKKRRMAPRGSRHGMAKLTEEQVAEILRDYRRGSTTRGLRHFADKFDVDLTMISLIVRRKNRRHVDARN